MTNKFLILAAILGVVLTTQGSAQESVRAVMNVSVTVMKTNGTEVPHTTQFQLSPGNSEGKRGIELGSFVFSDTGITDGYLEFPDKVMLYNSKGEEIQFAVKVSKKSTK